MNADTLDFSKLFGADIRYVVPMFQRPYVWERERQWEPLWQDIADVAEALLDAYARYPTRSEAEASVPPHFLGAVVLDPLPHGSGQVDARHVIDGQQRLTSLQLLIAAIQATASRDSRTERHARVFSKLITNDDDLIDPSEPAQAHKVWPTKWDRESFTSAMQDEPTTGRVADAYRYFKGAVDSWISEMAPTEGDVIPVFDALQVVVRSLLKIVVIDLEPNDNAQAIFEVLNARGTELLAVDLVKNLAFRVAETEGEEVQRLYEAHWQKFDTEPWRREVVVGRLRRGRADQFLQHWLVMRTASDVHSQQLFPTFRTVLDASDRGSVEDLVADLSRYADIYDSFETFAKESRDGAFFRRIDTLDVTTFVPLFLLLYGLDTAGFSDADRTRALGAIESWLVRRAILRRTTKDYNKVVPTLVGRVTADSKSPADAVIKWLREAQGDTREWPADEQVRHELTTGSTYTSIKRARLRMVLEAVEHRLRTGLSEQLTTASGLHIEHVLPQDWRKHWPVSEGGDQAKRELERDAAKHRLGNLTLLTAKLNSAESNRPWAQKRELLRQHSLLKLSQSIVDNATWDEERIDERSGLLADLILEIWPGPDALVWSASPT